MTNSVVTVLIRSPFASDASFLKYLRNDVAYDFILTFFPDRLHLLCMKKIVEQIQPEPQQRINPTPKTFL